MSKSGAAKEGYLLMAGQVSPKLTWDQVGEDGYGRVRDNGTLVKVRRVWKAAFVDLTLPPVG